MKKTLYTRLFQVVAGASLLVMGACTTSDQVPTVEYMPDMYRSEAYEPYSGAAVFADSMEARVPAAGSIPRGYMPYELPATNEGYEMAGNILKNPLPARETVIGEGKVIYGKFCIHCHGETGAGDGLTVKAGHPAPPAYNSAALQSLPEGKMFHSITYGKNLMGAHGSQLNAEERWKVIRYVQTLQNPGGAAPADTTTTDSTAVAAQ